MVIKPKQALELTEQEKKQIRELEIKIDRTLQKRFREIRDTVTFDIPEGIGDRFNETVCIYGQRVINEIERMYGEAGWNVEYECDQREGRWLEFRARKNYKDD